MKETVEDNKQKRQEKFMQEHTLTQEQFQKLIKEKTARAKTVSEAFIKREELLSRFR